MMINHFKLYRPAKKFPEGIRPDMFRLARIVLLREENGFVECFFKTKQSVKKNYQEVEVAVIPKLPPNAKKITKKKFDWFMG